MAGDFVSALRVEIARIEAELQADRRYRRLVELQRLLGSYSTDDGLPDGERSLSPADERSSILYRSGRRPSPDRQNAMTLARTFLSTKIEPTPVREIYEFLTLNGAQIAGENPLNNLSAMLSQSDEFISSGRAGWMMSTNIKAMSEDIVSAIVDKYISSMSTQEMTRLSTRLRHNMTIGAESEAAVLSFFRQTLGREINQEERRIIIAYASAKIAKVPQ